MFVTSLPDLSSCTTWQEFAERLVAPIHRAALICAVARQHATDGKPLRNPRPLTDELHAVIEMMREDLRTPLMRRPMAETGDARDLSALADDSIAGILTSPPYLSRHDYTRLTRPHEQVYGYWQPTAPPTRQRKTQVRAHPKAYRRDWGHAQHPSVAEACDALRLRGETKLAGIVRSYFDDLTAAMHEFARVLRGGGPCWLVIAGARLKNVYIPSDTIIADMAQDCGFTAVELRVARRLINIGRNFGGLTNVSPRETLLVLRRNQPEVG
ncbi:MAG: hypothetical protein IID33_17245 [Planctomycetes bacterium]|nr:hypothetical protein [Planctomycetota bacterium]